MLQDIRSSMNTTVIANSSVPDMMLMNEWQRPIFEPSIKNLWVLYCHTRYKGKISDCPMGHWAKLFGPIGLFNTVVIFFDNIMILYREDTDLGYQMWVSRGVSISEFRIIEWWWLKQKDLTQINNFGLSWCACWPVLLCSCHSRSDHCRLFHCGKP